jgi:hypothetical protein
MIKYRSSDAASRTSKIQDLSSLDYETLIHIQRQYFDWFAEKFQINTIEEWYLVKNDTIKENGGKDMLQYYGGSLSALLMCTYEDVQWTPWKFESVPQHYWDDPDHQLQFFDWLAEQLQFKDINEWYTITTNIIGQYGGWSILNRHNNSLVSAITCIYPDHDWQVWRFESVPMHYWENEENQRNFFHWLSEKLNVHSLDDWYKIKKSDFTENGAAGLLHSYCSDSPCIGLSIAYPDTEWQPWRFEVMPHGYWNVPEYRMQYAEYLADKLEVMKMDDWYKISAKDFAENCGSSLLRNYYEDSPSLAIMSFYPEYDWQPWRFETVQQHHWEKLENRRNYFDWLAEQLKCDLIEDWYGIDQGTFLEFGGHGILHHYDRSIRWALLDIYKDTNWQPWRFDSLPHRYWDELEHRIQYMEYIRDRMNFNNGMEDWYSIREEDIDSHGFSKFYDRWVGYAVMDIYPEHIWEPWRFQEIPRGFWDDLERQRNYADWLADRLGISQCEDWYECSLRDLIDHYGQSLANYWNANHGTILSKIYRDTDWKPWRFQGIKMRWNPLEQYEFVRWLEDKYDLTAPSKWQGITRHFLESNHGKGLLWKYGGSISSLLSTHYPDMEWNWNKWMLNGSSQSQWILRDFIAMLLPKKCEVEINYSTGWMSSNGKTSIHFDVWIPSHNVAFEYQGIQHYLHTSFVHEESSLSKQNERDLFKEMDCNRKNIRLVSVPFWSRLDSEYVGELLKDAIGEELEWRDRKESMLYIPDWI